MSIRLGSKAAKLAQDALVSIAFFQVVLTPYLLFWVGMDWAQYGRWNLANLVLSAFVGPLFARVLGWFSNV